MVLTSITQNIPPVDTTLAIEYDTTMSNSPINRRDFLRVSVMSLCGIMAMRVFECFKSRHYPERVTRSYGLVGGSADGGTVECRFSGHEIDAVRLPEGDFYHLNASADAYVHVPSMKNEGSGCTEAILISDGEVKTCRVDWFYMDYDSRGHIAL